MQVRVGVECAYVRKRACVCGCECVCGVKGGGGVVEGRVSQHG